MAKLFGVNKLRDLAKELRTEDLFPAIEVARKWHHDLHHGSLLQDNETAREQQYNFDFFGRILGYEGKPARPFSIEPKSSTSTGQIPDARLGYFDLIEDVENTSAVVELKGASISLDAPQRGHSNLSPVQQAFKYKPQYRNCSFAIVSNFKTFRLYRDNQLDFEEWTLDDLVDERDDYLQFKTFYLLLRAENFTAASGESQTEKWLSQIRVEQESIGKQFYREYKEARLELLRNIYSKNELVRSDIGLGIQKAQKIIDRLVFACFAEDRGLLPDNTVQLVVQRAETSFNTLWSELKSFFESVDRGSTRLEIPNGYNGGLFAKDHILDDMNIDDEPLKRVTNLSKYNFVEDLSVTILGHIFEQSISDLEQIRVKVYEANNLDTVVQSRRKKEGVFYTPDHIVNQIVDSTLGRYLREAEQQFMAEANLHGDINDANYQIREQRAYTLYQDFLQNVTVLDPACGSGAFLVEVFDYLVAENRRVAQILGNSLFSDEDFVRQLLQKNIYGVDLNEESVEITKLSLWLKSATKGIHLTALDDNIKCGNSLIVNPEVAGARAFDWSVEFPEVVARGGFDIVVGNPPWVFARGGNFSEVEKAHYYAHYPLANYQLNTYLLFIELSHRLIKPEGRIGVIVPNTCLTIDSFTTFRKFLIKSVGDLEITNIFGAVFEDAAVDSCIITFRKGAPTTIGLSEMDGRELTHVGVFEPEAFSTGSFIINIALMKDANVVKVMAHIDAIGVQLDDMADIKSGLVAYETGKGHPIQTEEMKKARVYHSRSKQGDTSGRYLQGRDVCRYLIDWSGEWIEYGPNLAAPRGANLYLGPRILVRQIPSKPPYCINAAYTDEHVYNDRNSMIVRKFTVDPHFILGVLNSRLSSFWFINKFDKLQRGTFPQFKVKELAIFPIPEATPEQQLQVARLVTEMQSAQQQLKALTEDFKLLAMRSFGSATWPKSYTAWWELDKPAFLTALPSSLPMASREEMLDLFMRRQPDLIRSNESIASLDVQLDALVEYLFGLSAEESKLIHS